MVRVSGSSLTLKRLRECLLSALKRRDAKRATRDLNNGIADSNDGARGRVLRPALMRACCVAGRYVDRAEWLMLLVGKWAHIAVWQGTTLNPGISRCGRTVESLNLSYEDFHRPHSEQTKQGTATEDRA